MDKNKTPQSASEAITTQQASKLLLDEFMRPLDPLLSKDDVTNILIFSWDKIVYDDNKGRHIYDGELFKNENDFFQLLAQSALDTVGETFSKRNPVIHASLPNGNRMAASMEPISPTGPRAAIRIFPKSRFSLSDLSSFGMFPERLIPTLIDIVVEGHNVLFSGSTNAGKTTFMNAMLQELPKTLDHVLVVEDVPELALPDVLITSLLSNHRIKRFDGRPCTLATLIEDALRATPDRIIVGEIRGGDAATSFFDALNTGHSGVCATLHANSAKASLTRLARLIIPETGLPFDVIHESLQEFIGIAINVGFDEPHQRRISGKKLRRVQQIVKFSDGGTEDIYNYDDELKKGVDHG